MDLSSFFLHPTLVPTAVIGALVLLAVLVMKQQRRLRLLSSEARSLRSQLAAATEASLPGLLKGALPKLVGLAKSSTRLAHLEQQQSIKADRQDALARAASWVGEKWDDWEDAAEAAAKAKAAAATGQLLCLEGVPFSGMSRCEFGGAAMREHFFLRSASEHAFLNNGSYGCTPRAVSAHRVQWEHLAARDPVRFRFLDLPVRMAESVARISRFIGCDPNWCVLCTNVNEAVASVLRSIVLRPGDVMLFLSVEVRRHRSAIL